MECERCGVQLNDDGTVDALDDESDGHFADCDRDQIIVSTSEADRAQGIVSSAWLPDHVEYAAQYWDGETWQDGYYSPNATPAAAAKVAADLRGQYDMVRVVERTAKTRVVVVKG